MKVNKVIYVVLAFILGWCGIHKFYSNQLLQGILHLIFFWTGILGGLRMKNIIQRVFRALAVGYIVKAIRNLISKNK